MARRPKGTGKDSKGLYVTLYKPEYCEKLIDHMGKGYSFTSFCAEVKICRATGYRWIQTIPEFFDAKRVADDAYEKWWEEVGRGGALGLIKGFNAAAWIFSMKNRFNWSDKQEVIQTNAKVQVDKMTDTELLEYVKDITKDKKDANPNSVSTRH